MVNIDLKDLVGSKIVGGIEGGRTNSFATLTIKLKTGEIYHLYGKNDTNIVITDKNIFRRDLRAVYVDAKNR